MAYTYHGTNDLIALPNRTVQTFPSGLVRIERSFVCKKSQVAKYRNTLKVNEPMPFDNGAPAIDGIYIFPEPQEVVRDDGFVEFRVTAYGRTNIFSEISVERSSIKGSYLSNEADLQGGFISLPSINEIYIIRGVLPSSESPNILLTAPEIENPLVIPIWTGIPLVGGSIRNPNPIEVNGNIYYIVTTTGIYINLDAYSSTNLGRFAEYIVTWKATASVSIYYAG